MILNPFTVNTAIHLNIEIISSELLVICSSLWIGVKLTIFFKRGFRWREHFFSRLRLNIASLILIIAAQFLLPMIIARLDSPNLIVIIAAQFLLQMKIGRASCRERV